jgi:hypothetical protein
MKGERWKDENKEIRNRENTVELMRIEPATPHTPATLPNLSHPITAYSHLSWSKINGSLHTPFCSMKHSLERMHTAHGRCIFWNMRICEYVNMKYRKMIRWKRKDENMEIWKYGNKKKKKHSWVDVNRTRDTSHPCHTDSPTATHCHTSHLASPTSPLPSPTSHIPTHAHLQAYAQSSHSTNISLTLYILLFYETSSWINSHYASAMDFEHMKRWTYEPMNIWKDEHMKRWKDEKMKRWKDENMEIWKYRNIKI